MEISQKPESKKDCASPCCLNGMGERFYKAVRDNPREGLLVGFGVGLLLSLLVRKR
jgi:hypothetical protein